MNTAPNGEVARPNRRRLAHIPTSNPLAQILARDLLGHVTGRKRHGRKHVVTVDYFCGAGGMTTGIERAREQLGLPGYHYGINHEPRAIQTISSNHHGTFINSSVEAIPVREIVREGYMTLFAGAAECIMSSPARRKDLPIFDQSRTSAAYMLEAMYDLPPEAFILENVVEWQRWSVLDSNNRPIKGREGEYFRAFVKALRDMGYNVEWRPINAANFGSCTSRNRLFMLGTADNRPILWPVQTHAKNPAKHPEGNYLPWRASREIIDWSDLGLSLFDRADGPHAPKSLWRMRTGFDEQDALLAPGYAEAIGRLIPIAEAFHATRAPKFTFSAEDFTRNPALLNHFKKPARKTVKKAISPLTGTERRFISNVWRAMYGLQRANTELTNAERKQIRALAITHAHSATRVAFASPCADIWIDTNSVDLESFLIANRTHATAHGTDTTPTPTMTTAPGGGIAHVAPMLLGQQGGAAALNVNNEPAPTIAVAGAIGAINPTLIKMNVSESSTFNDATRSPDKPLATVLPKTCLGLSTPIGPSPMVSAYYGPKDGNARVPGKTTDPLPTIPTENRFAFVNGTIDGNTASPDALLVTMNHGGDATSRVSIPDEPVGAMTARNAFGLAQPFIARQNGFYGETDATRAIEPPNDPLSSINAGGNHHALVSPTDPFLLKQRCPSPDDSGLGSVADPAPVITTIARTGLVNGYILNRNSEGYGGKNRTHSFDDPTPGATSRGAGYVVTTDLTATDVEQSAAEPRSTTTRYAHLTRRPGNTMAATLKPWILINGEGYTIDVLFRMLKVIELARAMGFITSLHDYSFAGSESDQVRQIGNAVAVEPAQAHAYALLKQIAELHFGYRIDKTAAA